MRNTLLILFLITAMNLMGQEEKVNQIKVAKVNSEVLKKYTLEIEKERWNTQQDVFNSLAARIPSLNISLTGLNQLQSIRLRNRNANVIIIDGVRYTDLSILNTLNPQDIEKIEVFPNAISANRPTASFKN